MAHHSGKKPGSVPDGGGSGRRPGSRFLLGLALAGAVVGAVIGGALVAELLCDLAGVTSNLGRLGVKVAGIAAALPAGFFLIERFFLNRANRGGGHKASFSGQKPE